MHATIHPATSPRTLPLRHRPLALALAAALMAMPASGLAQVAANQLPTGGSIVGGTGTINAASGTTRVVDQTSARMALTWSAFDIGSAATMTFNQPTTTSVVLNLVQGGNPTQIFGNLTANGQVFLLNSNGVLLGSTANINVGGLVVSTLGTSVSQFMNGNYVFDAGGNTVALVSNSGTINAAAGSATLIGGRVANSGTITATAGNITLAGADAATLTFESGGFGVLIDKPLQLSLATEAVDNSGTLSAPGGAIQLQARAAQGIFDRLINNSGTIRASSLSNGPDGSVSLIASGAGSLDVAGGGSIDAGTGAITLSTGRGVQQTGIYTAGSLGGFIGGSATFSGANKIGGLGNLDVGGNLSLTNTVALSQSGSLAVTGTSQFLQSGSALSLTNGGNTFGGLLSASGNGIAVNAAGNLSIGTLNLDSNSALSLSASGVLTLPTTAINTGSANLTLTSGGGLTTRAALAGTNVDLTGSGGIALAHDVTASGALKLTATNNAITQTAGSVAATGTSTINAGTGAITLDGASNDFQGAVALTGGNTRISDSGALTLGAVTSNDLTATSNGALNLGSGRVGGALLATSNNGAITQSGTDGLTILGTSNLTAGTGAITLTNSGNTFGDLVSATGRGISLNAAGTLSIGTLSLGNNSALSLRATGALTLPAAAINTGSANLTLSSGGSLTTRAALAGTNVDLTGTAGITLAHDVTASGTLALTTTDSAITQTGGSVTATGTGTVSAGTGVIELDEATNDFQGVVTLTGGDTRIADTGALTLGALNTGNLIATSNGALNLGSGSVRGTLAATSGNGAISQGAGLIVDGTATLNAGSGAIALTDGNNDFRSGVSLIGTGISVVDRDDLRIASISNGTDGAIALTAGGALTLPTQNLSTGTGALSLTANGGALSTLGALSGGNVSLSARDGVVLNHNVTAGGTLGLTATNATITQNAGVLDVGGLATVDAGNGAISLTGDNDFKNGIALTGRNIAVVDANDLSVVSLSNGGAGAIALTARNSLTLPGSGLTSTDNLTLRADNGTLTLGGDLLGNAVSLFSANALTLATGIDSNTLSVSTSNSAINQTAGALRLGSTSSFDTGTGAIALGSAGNHFGGAVSLTGNGVSIRDSGALSLGTLNTGSLTATSNGALNLGSGRVAGTLAATSGNGAIGQAGGLIVDAAATLNAGSGAIALTDGSNDFQGSMRLTGAGIAVRDSNDLTLSALTSNNGGTVALTAGGNLILPGTTLNNGSGNINLIANHLSLSAALLGEEVSLRANSGLTLGQNITARTLSLASSNAAITQSGGALLVSGATTVDAGTGAISLLQAGNNFDSVRLTGNGIGVTDGDNLSLAALTSTGTGAVVVTAGGTLSLPSQAIAVGNSNLTLSSNGGALSTAADLGGNDVTLFGRDGLTLGHTVTANTLALHSTDAAIVQNAGALDVVGASTVDAGSASIALNSGSNRFGAGISLTGTGITVADSGNLTINALNAGANGTIALTAGGALNLSAQNLDTGTADLALIANGGSMSTGGDLRGRNVTLSARDGLTIGHTITTTETLSLSSNNTAMTQTAAALNVGTTTTVNAGSGNVTLNTAGNTFNGVVNLTAGDVQIAGNALSFGALSTNALTANSSGALSLGSGVVRGALNGTSGNAAITQSGGLSVGGASTLNAGSGDIALTDANNDFVGALALTGNAIAVQDRNDLSIAAARSGANAAIALVAGGDLNLPASQIDAGTGALTLTANGGTLRTAGALRGGTVQLTGANGIALSNTVTASNVLRLNSTNAAITQTGGALLVAGDTAVDAGGGAIALEAAGNDFQGVLALTGGASSVRDANALTLGTLNTGDLQVRNSGALNLGVGLVNGDLDAASNGGAVTQSGALTVTGSTRINSGGAAIALTDADNDFQAAVSLSGSTASVRDRNALVLGNLDVDALEVASGAGLDLGQGRIGGALVARSGSAATANANTVVAQAIAVPAATAAGIAQQGALTVVGSSLLDAGTGAIVLDAADNDFQGTVQARGSSIAIVDRNDLAATAQASDAQRL
ncbi:hypothetical protein NY96_28335, partial [Xanthomonas citri pv. fuscans]|uniref:two-partner secretion domain-containing protein n=1 Tax=Xanthomonas citri TaxID=346 RepID=UPI00062B394C